jgi:hypothetical protein
MGLPTCACGTVMTVPELRDLVAVDDSILDTLSHRARNQAMRALGWTDQIVRKAPPRRTRQKQCVQEGCSRFVGTFAQQCAAGHPQREAMPF